jgi:hypothetical protein
MPLTVSPTRSGPGQGRNESALDSTPQTSVDNENLGERPFS